MVLQFKKIFMQDEIMAELATIKQLITEQTLLKKEVLTLGEAAAYMQVSVSHIYKLHCNGELSSYCPTGKKLYFKRSDLDQFLLRNRQGSSYEIEQQAADYLIKKGRISVA